MKKFIKENWGRFVFELITIIAGVLIALAVNEVRQNYAQQELADTALKSIVAEIESNKKFIEQRLPYHRRMVHILDSLALKNADRPFREVGRLAEWRGIQPPILSDAAWQTAIQSGALAKSDFEKVTQIAKLYSFQNAYIRWGDNYIAAVIGGDLASVEQYKNLFYEMGTTGGELVLFYASILNAIQTNK